MKKIIFILLSIFLIIGSASSEEKSCEDKKLMAKIICKSGLSKDKTKKLTNVELDTSNVKDKKYIVDWFKKKE